MSRTIFPPDASNTSSHAPIPLPTLRHVTAQTFGAEKSTDGAERPAPASGANAGELTPLPAVGADHGREARKGLDLPPTVPVADEAQASFTFIAASELAAPAVVAPFGQAEPAPQIAARAPDAPGAGGPIPSDAVPIDAIPSGALPRDVLPSDAIPSDALPSGALPSDAIPSDALPSDALPSGALSSGALPSGALPSDAIPSDAVPSDAVPSDAAPSDAVPSELMPGHSSSHEAAADVSDASIASSLDALSRFEPHRFAAAPEAPPGEAGWDEGSAPVDDQRFTSTLSGDGAGSGEASTALAVSEPSAPTEPARKPHQPLTRALDAAAKLAADANAAAEALDSLKRLLEQGLPVATGKGAHPASPSERPVLPPRLPPRSTVALSPPPPLPPVTLPVPMPSTDRVRFDLRGFLAGFALSWAIGVVLYLFMTAG